MTVRKGIPPAGEAPQGADFWTLCPEVTLGQVVPKLCWELKIEKLCFDKYCTCFGRTGYIQSFVPKNSMEFLIILVEKFGLK